jgi:hypothetical protein|tara:strand:+ start:390 stop:734 length:345 start_codon:yes stop_codon:yes gene_type:complete
MSNDTQDIEVITSLKELFTEYVTLHRKVGSEGSQYYEFKIPWHTIRQVEGYLTDPSKYESHQKKPASCSDIWWHDQNGDHKSEFLETPDQVEHKITQARDKTLSAIKKNRMMIF